MKFRRLSAAALVAVIGAGTLLPAAASAAPGENYTASGSVEITSEGITPPEKDDGKIDDPEIPGKFDPDEEIKFNEDPGDLAVTRVAPLNFGNFKVGSTAGDVVLPAKAISGSHIADDGTTTTTTCGHLVTFEDARGTREGYIVKAELTQQFTLVPAGGGTSTETLADSSINYTNGIIANRSGSTTPTLFASNFTLDMDKGAVNVVGSEKEQGAGEYTLEFGQSPEYNSATPGTTPGGLTDTAAKSVFLTIPQKTATNMLAGNYAAKITWSIEASPYQP